ncbi:MAG: hypothetical protein HDT23_06380 [Ruminococcus sp.]|nr:hypothetical protein [Ruminococcus sp.]
MQALDHKIVPALQKLKNGKITPEEYKRIFIERKIEKSRSYTTKLIRPAEIETRYSEKYKIQHLHDNLNNSSEFFYEYLGNYQGRDSELAENAMITKSTISKIKNHTYKSISKNSIISLAIALDLTVEDRKRFINSAGFSYPVTEHDHFIEQQLRKKRYTTVQAFNDDICEEYPQFVISNKRYYKK